MEQLIKITTEPMRMVRFSQNARLVNSNSIDMERRKAIARQNSFRNSAGQGTVSVEDIKRINRTFSKKNASVETSNDPSQQTVSRQIQSSPLPSVQEGSISLVSEAPVMVETTSAEAAVASNPVEVPDISVQSNSSYAVQRGSF